MNSTDAQKIKVSLDHLEYLLLGFHVHGNDHRCKAASLGVRAEIDALQAERDTYRDGLGACKGIIVGLQTERDALQETVQGLTKGLEKQGWEVKELRTQLEAAQKDYNDLIYCVSQKFKNETRHQTAKRYLLSWEGRSDAAIAATKGTTE